MAKQHSRVWPYALTIMIAGALMVMSPAASWAMHWGTEGDSTKSEDVRDTIHNLGSSSRNTNNLDVASAGTSEVCVFCHTPHGAQTAFQGSAPLWNRNFPTTGGYTMYSSPNFDGISTIGAAPVGVSLACLSCHDGTVALDALINGAGSGVFHKANLTDGSSESLGLVVGAGGSSFISGGKMSGGLRSDTGPNYGTILGGARPFPNLTQDLSDDHPLSFEMPASLDDPQFNVTLITPSNNNIKLVSRGAASVDDKRDSIRLYPKNGGTAFTDETTGWVECASCHNPHAPRPLVLRLPGNVQASLTPTDLIPTGGPPSGWGGNGTATWNDDPNSGSAICLTCHDK